MKDDVARDEALDDGENSARQAIELGNRQRRGVGGSQRRWKVRRSVAGLHLFERNSGMNVLLDELQVPHSQWSRAPRQVSIALTNRCDLACAHCYAPKSRDELCFDAVARWLTEIDSHGTLGVGFGGGEPTLYRRFPELCRYAVRETKLAVTFTTHGHHIDPAMADELQGSVHFIRVSMDGVGDTYESIRRRSFRGLQARLRLVRSISRFGINIVVNDRTVRELDEAADFAADSGACELLLLPQVRVRNVPAITGAAMQELQRWVVGYSGPLKLCINEGHSDDFPTCDPLVQERGLRAYAHVDASGIIKPSSYHGTGVAVGEGGFLEALEQLAQEMAEDNL